ncbi:MAG: Rhodanese-related sulfurtransferase [Pseudonocardiales bacterium]|nr:Rhodanese-related sulfurtransferase [Pseudonocardiales bacterium]
MTAEALDPRNAAEMMRAGDTIIDVRTASEYANGHISGAINIPIDLLPSADLPEGQLITTCSMGGRAGRAADLLDSMGRTAFSIRGGTSLWQNAGLPVVIGPDPGPALS